ncbi:hypothetical protein LPB19_16650 [Marinobacter salinisoli]|uniref:Lysozyme n=1 Tax=Marinobacter salinisoli TaxID=2769486 RepID=A0ABX7MR11_9GAMM|nr:hypothetical protein [Marinobacter salinisoli]QSP94776.1 hypothetical protein LPB19_16650 [Marinobacter salinisoli]
MTTFLKPRIQRIQRHLGITADGVIGVETLTAIENQLFGPPSGLELAAGESLVVSKQGLKKLVDHEISSPAYYRRHLCSPVYPGGQSGVTIGIGYDLGYNTANQIRSDWAGLISDSALEQLMVVCGLKGSSAKSVIRNLGSLDIPLDAAEEVFYQCTLPRYAKKTAQAYPGVETLFPDAQAAMLSLVYNRGTRMSGARRREMKALQDWVKNRDYQAMAEAIRAMKRLWVDQGLPGLLKRRDDEAKLVLGADREYADDELIRL